MINKLFKILLIFAVTCYLSGCASNAKLPETFWQDHKQKILIVHAEAPTPGAQEIGGYPDLVNIVSQQVRLQKFEDSLSSTDMGWYNQLGDRFTNKLATRQINAINYTLPLRYIQKDYYLSLANKNQSDKVLIIKINTIGAIRHVFMYFPTGAPKAVCQITAELRNVSDNKLIWSHTSAGVEVVNGEWDQPPTYPNFTAALKRAIDNAQNRLLDNFFDGKPANTSQENILSF